MVAKVDFKSGASTCYYRLKVGGNVIMAGSASTTFVTIGTAVFLAAGTYDILLEHNCNSSYGDYWQNFYVGLCLFNDLQYNALGTYSSGVALTVANRVTPAGPLANATWLIVVNASTPAATTNFENVGDNLTNGVSIAMDGTQFNWDERWNPLGNGDYGIARCAKPFSVGTSHTIAITKRNANTVVLISIVACPWILPYALFQPLTLSFSQGSTFYSSLEPLFLDPTKFVGVGAARGISFGAASDYYSSQSGTSLIQYSLTMDVLDVTMSVFFYGLGGCIGYIAVDVR